MLRLSNDVASPYAGEASDDLPGPIGVNWTCDTRQHDMTYHRHMKCDRCNSCFETKRHHSQHLMALRDHCNAEKRRHSNDLEDQASNDPEDGIYDHVADILTDREDGSGVGSWQDLERISSPGDHPPPGMRTFFLPS